MYITLATMIRDKIRSRLLRSFWQHCVSLSLVLSFLTILLALMTMPVIAQSRKVNVRGQSDEDTAVKNGDASKRTKSNEVEGSEKPAERDRKLTLLDLEQLAEDNHPMLRRSRARVTSAQGQELQQGLYPNPRFDSNNPEIFNGQNSLYNIGFQQEIVTRGKLRLSKAAANRMVGQSELAYVSDRFALLTAIRRQYFTTLAAQRRVGVVSDLKRVAEDALKVGKDLFGAETIPKTEVLLLEVDFEQVQADLASFRRRLEGERKQLSAIVGIPGLVDSKLEGSLTIKPPLFDEESLRSFVTSNNVQIQIAKLEIERTKIMVKRQEVEAFPNITMGPAFQQGILPGNQQFWLNLSFPIPTSNRNQGNIVSARADARVADESLSSLQLELQNQVADVYSRHQAALERAQKYRSKIIPDAFQMIGLARDGFKNGVFDFSKYLQVQRTLVDANMRYTDILEEVWTTASDLAGLLQIEQFP